MYQDLSYRQRLAELRLESKIRLMFRLKLLGTLSYQMLPRIINKAT